jgi:predicted CXXCH cytochrome family protein
MPPPVKGRAEQRSTRGHKESASLYPWLAGLLTAVACICLLAAFGSGPTLAAEQDGRRARTAPPPLKILIADISPTPASWSLVTATAPSPTATPQPEASPTPTATGAPPQKPGEWHLLQDPVPTPTAPPPEPTAVPVAGDPHVSYLATTASCAACHRAHTASGRALRGTWPEESLCFACHGGDGPGTDVAAAFVYANSATAFFQHDVAATNGVHRAGEMEASAYGGENRHVECEDCHQPHEATRGTAAAPMLQLEMNAVSGVEPVWAGHVAPVDYIWLPEAERESQVCFKCHSSFTTLPDYAPDGWDGSGYIADGLRKLTSGDPQQVPDSRDMASEFNPYQASFHPVVAQGRNQNIPAGAFVAGWSQTSIVYCTDCHSNPAASASAGGAHGSPFLHLLNGSAEYQTANHNAPELAGTELCFQCHDADDYLANGSDSNFARRNRNLHAQHADEGTCYLCHDSHGSEQLHLLNLDLSIVDGTETYLLSGYDGLPTNSQTYWQISPDGSDKTCWIVCHGHDHAGSTYPNTSD